jgi:hypothetical protein
MHADFLLDRPGPGRIDRRNYLVADRADWLSAYILPYPLQKFLSFPTSSRESAAADVFRANPEDENDRSRCAVIGPASAPGVTNRKQTRLFRPPDDTLGAARVFPPGRAPWLPRFSRAPGFPQRAATRSIAGARDTSRDKHCSGDRTDFAD